MQAEVTQSCSAAATSAKGELFRAESIACIGPSSCMCIVCLHHDNSTRIQQISALHLFRHRSHGGKAQRPKSRAVSGPASIRFVRHVVEFIELEDSTERINYDLELLAERGCVSTPRPDS